MIQKLPSKYADLVADAMFKLLVSYQKKVYTITADNSKEFANHKQIVKELKANVYFAHSYHSWELGFNENTNGLIPQYFPQKLSFEKITDEQVQMLMNRLNNRPRKTFGFEIPNEVFFGQISN